MVTPLTKQAVEQLCALNRTFCGRLSLNFFQLEPVPLSLNLCLCGPCIHHIELLFYMNVTKEAEVFSDLTCLVTLFTCHVRLFDLTNGSRLLLPSLFQLLDEVVIL
ncbi:hypothetical protein AMECASPLE_029405 [Ameca splendens]|uniref:Uncharacterized protein n=1 Tax=Ameca splendens TaxID=208324 RepID=A0ABV1AD42_9TELE